MLPNNNSNSGWCQQSDISRNTETPAATCGVGSGRRCRQQQAMKKKASQLVVASLNPNGSRAESGSMIHQGESKHLIVNTIGHTSNCSKKSQMKVHSALPNQTCEKQEFASITHDQNNNKSENHCSDTMKNEKKHTLTKMPRLAWKTFVEQGKHHGKRA